MPEDKTHQDTPRDAAGYDRADGRDGTKRDAARYDQTEEQHGRTDGRKRNTTRSRRELNVGWSAGVAQYDRIGHVNFNGTAHN